MIRRYAGSSLALFLFIGLPAGAAWPATFALTSPLSATCVTDPQAVYSVQNGVLKPVSGQFSIFSPGEQPLQPVCSMTSSAAPGQLARFYLWSTEPLSGLSAQIGAAGKNPLTRSTGFRASTSEAVEMWAVLIGIPADSAVKQLTVTLTAVAGDRTFMLLKPFSVTARKFLTEKISLTKDLTALVTVPNPQQTIESKRLAEILSTPHPDALYATQAFDDPLPGARRSAGYGDRREYLYTDGTDGLSIHYGVDIASPTGTPVPACAPGKVVLAENRILTGNSVVIEHLPGLFSVYYHMSALVVKEGDVVDKGDIIGKVGMTGFATGPHLHWEVENMGVAVDPDSLVNGPLLDKSADFIDIE